MNEASTLNAPPAPTSSAVATHEPQAGPRLNDAVTERADFWFTVGIVGVVAAAFAACLRVLWA